MNDTATGRRRVSGEWGAKPSSEGPRTRRRHPCFSLHRAPSTQAPLPNLHRAQLKSHTRTATMTITEKIKEVVGLGHGEPAAGQSATLSLAIGRTIR